MREANGKAMPTNLTEALALDVTMAENFDADNEETVLRYILNWEAIHSGRFPIRSPEEAAALLNKMVAEMEHSSGDFVSGILDQINDYIARLANAAALQAA